MEKENQREIERDGNGEKEMAKLNFQKGEGLLPAIVQDYKTNEVLMPDEMVKILINFIQVKASNYL